MRNNYITGPRRGPHMDDCPGMGELAQTPDDQVTYGGWTTTQSLNLGPAISAADINNGKIECTPPPPVSFTRGIDIQNGSLEVGEPFLVAHEAIRLGSDHYLIPATELAALRADHERIANIERLGIDCACVWMDGKFRFGARPATSEARLPVWADSLRAAVDEFCKGGAA